MESSGLRTLHTIPRYDLAYLRLISREVSCRMTNAYWLRRLKSVMLFFTCLFFLTSYSFRRITDIFVNSVRDHITADRPALRTTLPSYQAVPQEREFPQNSMEKSFLAAWCCLNCLGERTGGKLCARAVKHIVARMEEIRTVQPSCLDGHTISCFSSFQERQDPFLKDRGKIRTFWSQWQAGGYTASDIFLSLRETACGLVRTARTREYMFHRQRGMTASSREGQSRLPQRDSC